MFDRFERPVKILCLGLAALLVWQLGSLVLSVIRDPLAHLKIPALPALPGATNEIAKGDQKGTNTTNTAGPTMTGTNGTNATTGTNVVNATNTVHSTNIVSSTNGIKGTNIVSSTNLVTGTNVMAKGTNPPVASLTSPTGLTSPTNASPHKPGQPGGASGLPPGMMAQMMGGGRPGGGRAGGAKKMELPPEIQVRVDKIIASEIFGSLPRPMPMALLGIADQEAFIQATNGQSGPVKVGDEIGGIKLLRISLNRVLVETDGEKKELTIFDGIGSESLMPKATSEPSTNLASTNAPSTNAPEKKVSKRKAAASNAATNQTISSKQ
jgi:hypothetical protein